MTDPTVEAVARERIISAAIHFSGVIMSMPSPARHHSIINNAHHNFSTGYPHLGEQGFLTSAGRFVNRVEAMTIAKNAEQIRMNARPSAELFSEDLYGIGTIPAFQLIPGNRIAYSGE